MFPWNILKPLRCCARLPEMGWCRVSEQQQRCNTQNQTRQSSLHGRGHGHGTLVGTQTFWEDVFLGRQSLGFLPPLNYFCWECLSELQYAWPALTGWESFKHDVCLLGSVFFGGHLVVTQILGTNPRYSLAKHPLDPSTKPSANSTLYHVGVRFTSSKFAYFQALYGVYADLPEGEFPQSARLFVPPQLVPQWRRARPRCKAGSQSLPWRPEDWNPEAGKNYIGDESKVKTQATRMHCGAIVHLVCCLWPTRCTRLGEKKHKEWEGERLKYVTIQLLGCPILTHSHFFTHVNPSLSSLFHAMLMAFHCAKLSSLIRVQCSSLLARPVFLLLWPSQGGITTLLGTVRH